MVEMDTLLTVMRVKKTSSISAVFSDSKTLIDGATGVFHVVGVNPGFAYEKATLDSSCSFHDTTLTVTSTTFLASNYGLPVNTPYFMDVNTDGWQWLSGSSAVSCTINLPGGTTSVPAVEVPLNDLSAYPNPFTDEVNIIFKTNDASTAKIRIKDISGRIIIERAIQSNTVYSFGNRLKPGICFLKPCRRIVQKLFGLLRIINRKKIKSFLAFHQLPFPGITNFMVMHNAGKCKAALFKNSG